MIVSGRIATGMGLIEASALDDWPDPEWLINGVLIRSSIASMTGSPGTYKSFLALDIALSIAGGIPWQGQDTRQAPTVYVAGEGRSGIRRRVQAWEIRHGRSADGCFILPSAVQLLEPGEVMDLCAAIDDLGIVPGLIVFDTQARMTVGMEENSAREGGVLVSVLDELRQRYGAAILVLHHVGRNGLMRGTTALPGALDTHLEVNKDDDRVIVSCGKQKEAEEFTPLNLIRRVVELDDEGATSLIFDRDDSPAPVAVRPLTKTEQSALNALNRIGGLATASEWETACSEMGRATFYRAREALVKSGKVARNGAGRGATYRPESVSSDSCPRDGP